MIFNNFGYRNALRRNIEHGAFMMLCILITTVILDSITLGLILVIPLAFMFGINGAIDWLRKDDSVSLTPTGISFRRRGTSGFMRWDQIKEIEYDQMGFTIKAKDCRLRIRNDIEPDNLPHPNLFKRFISNTRYDRDLTNEIKNRSQVREVRWYNYSRS